jgi:hypothetical protein
VCRMAMTVVHIVGVVTVRDRDVATVRPMSVAVPVVHQVLAALAFVGVPFVATMEVTVVDVVDMVFVAERDVPATRPVIMCMIGMGVVHLRHGLHVLSSKLVMRCPPLTCSRAGRDAALAFDLQAVMASAEVVRYGRLSTPYDL